jgi:hypothetical protein
MNGVELPCHTILHAEPADMDYKNKKHTSVSTRMESIVTTASKESEQGLNSNIQVEKTVTKDQSKERGEKEEQEEKEDDDVELDDFFASLE